MPRARGQRVTIVNDKRVTTATALTRLGLGWYLGSATVFVLALEDAREVKSRASTFYDVAGRISCGVNESAVLWLLLGSKP